MKKIKILLVIICFSFSFNVFASTKVNIRTESDYLVPKDVIVDDTNKSDILNTPSINSKEYVYDFAELMTDKQEELLYDSIIDFYKEKKIELVLVTVKENTFNNSQKYLESFYKYNFFKDDCVLLLIDFEMNGVYMKTYGTPVELFPNSRMQPVLKNVYQLSLQGRIYDACNSFVNSIRGFVGLGEVVKGEDVVIDTDGTVKKNSPVVQALIFAFIATAIVMCIFVSLNKNISVATSSKEFLNKETMVINEISDSFVSENTKRKKRSK